MFAGFLNRNISKKNRHPVMQMKTTICFCVKWVPWRITSTSSLNEWTAIIFLYERTGYKGKDVFLLGLPPSQVPLFLFDTLHILQRLKGKKLFVQMWANCVRTAQIFLLSTTVLSSPAPWISSHRALTLATQWCHLIVTYNQFVLNR